MRSEAKAETDRELIAIVRRRLAKLTCVCVCMLYPGPKILTCVSNQFSLMTPRAPTVEDIALLGIHIRIGTHARARVEVRAIPARSCNYVIRSMRAVLPTPR